MCNYNTVIHSTTNYCKLQLYSIVMVRSLNEFNICIFYKMHLCFFLRLRRTKSYIGPTNIKWILVKGAMDFWFSRHFTIVTLA